MWDEPIEFINIDLLANSKRELLYQVLEMYSLPKLDFVFVFATEINDGIWGHLGNYIHVENATLENKTLEILNIFRMNKHRHMIWISPKICGGSDIWFVWVLAHEIKHSLQAIDNYSIIKSLDLFYAANGDLNILDSISFNIPAEIDCELFARRTVFTLFGEDQCNKFVQTKLHSSLRSVLDRIPLNNKYDVKEETIIVYRKYEQDYNNFIKEDPYFRDFNINKECLSLSQ